MLFNSPKLLFCLAVDYIVNSLNQLNSMCFICKFGKTYLTLFDFKFQALVLWGLNYIRWPTTLCMERERGINRNKEEEEEEIDALNLKEDNSNSQNVYFLFMYFCSILGKVTYPLTHFRQKKVMEFYNISYDKTRIMHWII